VSFTPTYWPMCAGSVKALASSGDRLLALGPDIDYLEWDVFEWNSATERFSRLNVLSRFEIWSIAQHHFVASGGAFYLAAMLAGAWDGGIYRSQDGVSWAPILELPVVTGAGRCRTNRGRPRRYQRGRVAPFPSCLTSTRVLRAWRLERDRVYLRGRQRVMRKSSARRYRPTVGRARPLPRSRPQTSLPVLWDTGSEMDRADGSFSAEFEAVMASVGPN